MATMKRWITAIPLLPLTIIAIFMALAPFAPEPHLWEKLKMLAAGELVRPIDIFDLVMHSAPLALLATSLWLRRGD